MPDRRLAGGGAIPPAYRPRRLLMRRRMLALAGLGLGLLGLGLLGLAQLAPVAPRLIWNASASAPRGLYRLQPEAAIRRGDLVLVRLPAAPRQLAAERGYLPAEIPLLKRVAALAGDRLCADGDRVRLGSGLTVQRLAADGQGRPLPAWQGCRVLGETEVFLLMAAAPASFDGRYFGPVTRSDVIGRLLPLWTE